MHEIWFNFSILADTWPQEKPEYKERQRIGLTASSTASAAATAAAAARVSSAGAAAGGGAAVAVVPDVRVARQVVYVGPAAVIQHCHLTVVLVDGLHLIGKDHHFKFQSKL